MIQATDFPSASCRGNTTADRFPQNRLDALTLHTERLSEQGYMLLDRGADGEAWLDWVARCAAEVEAPLRAVLAGQGGEPITVGQDARDALAALEAVASLGDTLNEDDNYDRRETLENIDDAARRMINALRRS